MSPSSSASAMKFTGSTIPRSLCGHRMRASKPDRLAVSIEMIGYFSTEPGSQKYPAPLSWFYPDTGDFIAFVGTFGNRGLVRSCIKVFRENAEFPSQGAALPSFLSGVEFSDHWSFRIHGFPAAMVTDTAFFRNQNYHTAGDTVESLDYDRMSRVVTGLVPVVEHLANR